MSSDGHQQVCESQRLRCRCIFCISTPLQALNQAELLSSSSSSCYHIRWQASCQLLCSIVVVVVVVLVGVWQERKQRRCCIGRRRRRRRRQLPTTTTTTTKAAHLASQPGLLLLLLLFSHSYVSVGSAPARQTHKCNQWNGRSERSTLS